MGMAYLRAPPSLSQRRARTRKPRSPNKRQRNLPIAVYRRISVWKKGTPGKEYPPPPPPPPPKNKGGFENEVLWNGVFFFVFGLAFQGKDIIVFRFNYRVY
jgi:hypothetical protein